ncbi:MAG: HAD family phosphatase [Chloroflexi bacterium]|nr:HAD family phosphatase [Chloroflexota bacterium]
MTRLRVVLIDVDGCLTPGEAKPWDFDVLRFVAELNQRAHSGAAPFAVTLCTGRQQPYVEAMMQAIDGYLPALYENGAGLYFPQPYRFLEHPAFTLALRAQRAEIKSILQRELVERELAILQPGKEINLTLYPARTALTLDEIAARARGALGSALGDFSLYASVSSVEILPPGIDKGAGAEWLAREIDIPLSEFGGIGDAPADLTFLKRVAHSAAPANATPDVKANVHDVSSFPDARGVQDILRRWLGAETH